jgi:AcrR family transcriptional regulator
MLTQVQLRYDPRVQDTKGRHRRGPAVEAAILAATLDELAATDAADVTVAAIAKRAGVHPTSIYRRWETRERLLLAAARSAAAALITTPDSGTWRGDLLALATQLQAVLGSSRGLALVRAALLHGDADDDVRRAFWTARMESLQPMLARAVERGEIEDVARAALAVEAVAGVLYLRALATGAPTSDLGAVVATVIR